jgi:hypothetical protein
MNFNDFDEADNIPPSSDKQLPYKDTETNMASEEGIFWIAGKGFFKSNCP